MRNYLSLIIRYLKSKIRNPQDLKICNLQSAICNLKPKICNPSGFTLIELAIVLVVVGLMVGLGAGMIGPMMKQYKYTQSRGIIDAAIESAISYAAGTEDIPDNLGGTADFKQVVTEPTDGFKKTLVYFPDASLSVADSREVCQRGTAEITVYTCDDSGCTAGNFDTINNVAFVFVSGGANFNAQTGNADTPPSIGTCPTTQCVTVYEQDTNLTSDPYTTDMDRTEEYDDIVKWVTLNELKTKAGCLGAPLKILNNELPYGIDDTQYTVEIFADGGIPFAGSYNWCIDSTVTFPNGITNPTSCTGTPSCNPLNAESNWTFQNSKLTITGTPTGLTGTRSFLIPIFVRDNNDGSTGLDNDNCARKTFVLTINPA